MADIEVNLGPTGGITALELALGRWPLTGKMSDELVAAAKTMPVGTLIVALGAVWLSKKHESPTWPQHGHGWTNRCVAANALALRMAGG